MPTEPDDAITRRRRQRADRQRVYLLVGAGALVGLVLGCCGGVSASLLLSRGETGGVSPIAALTGPSADREGRDWTLAELRDHLAGRGLSYRIADVPGGPHFRGGTFFIDAANRFDETSVAFNAEMAGDWTDVVRVEAFQDSGAFADRDAARAARDAAGRYEKQDRVFAWGRFFFYGSPERIKALRAALR